MSSGKTTPSPALTCVALLAMFAIVSSCAPSSSRAGGTASAGYDPSRDAAADIQYAIAEAKKSNRNVLMEVGGEWCVWCHILEKYFDDNPDIRDLRDRNYVTIKVNFSQENKNEAVLSKYPEIPGYPHLFVLDEDGNLLHSQDTGQLEAGKSYDREKFAAFLERWAPAGAGK